MGSFDLSIASCRIGLFVPGTPESRPEARRTHRGLQLLPPVSCWAMWGRPPSSTWASEQEPKSWFACLRYLLCRVKMLFTRWGRSDGQSLLSLRVQHALTNIGRMLSRLVRCDQHHGASWNPFWRRARNGHYFEEQLPRRPSPLRSGQRRMRTPPLGDSAASPWNATRRIRCFPGVNSFFSSGAIPPRCPRSRTAQF